MARAGDTMIKDLVGLGRRLGRQPTAKDLGRKNRTLGYQEYCKVFGSLNTALEKAGFYPKSNRKISKKIAIRELMDLGKRLGRTPLATDLGKRNRTPTFDTYKKLFGSMKNAVEAAGFQYNGPTFLSRKQLLAKIHRYFVINGVLPTANTYKDDKMFPSPTQFRREFGSFTNALNAYRKNFKQTGILERKSTRSTRRARANYPKSFFKKTVLKRMLNEAFKKNGKKPLSASELSKFGLPRVTHFRKIFGSWNLALLYADLPLAKTAKFKKADLIRILEMIGKRKGRTPRATDLGGNYPSYPTFVDKFGSWESALNLAGFEMSEGIYGKRARLWERKCEEISAILFKDSIFQKTFKGIGRPDIYIPSKNVIIDAKTTSYFVPEKSLPQLKKYLKVADRIELWCIHKTVERKVDRVRYVYAIELQTKLRRKGYGALAKSITSFLDENDQSRKQFGEYTKAEIKLMIRQQVKERKGVPSQKQWSKIPNVPSPSTLVKLFGTYNKAISEAGFTPNPSGQSMASNKLEIIETIGKFFRKHGKVPRKGDLMISDGSIKREFGTFDKAVRAAGLSAHRKKPSNQEIEIELKKLKRSLRGRDLKKVINNHPVLPKWDVLVKKLGSVEQIYLRIGLKYTYVKEWRKEDVVKHFVEFEKTHGFLPGSKQWDRLKPPGAPSGHAIRRLFGDWDAAKRAVKRRAGR